MSDPVFGDRQVEFPVEVHFRVVCDADAAVANSVRAAAADLGVLDLLEEGNRSKTGKYRSFQLSLMVETNERMREIDTAFRRVEGVKMVL